MRMSIFVLSILATGALAGLAYGVTNTFLAGPYLEAAVEMENQAMFLDGTAEDGPEFRVVYEAYREWQRGGQLLASVVLGMSVGALFGLVFALSRRFLLGGNHLVRSLCLAGIMWFVLYVMPFLRYPPNPPAVGDPETIALRTMLYLIVVVVSGLGALGFFWLGRILKSSRRIKDGRMVACLCIACYALFLAVLYFVMPPNPDAAPEIPTPLLDGFRMASAVGSAVLWASLGVMMGLFWTRLVRGDRKEEPRRQDS